MILAGRCRGHLEGSSESGPAGSGDTKACSCGRPPCSRLRRSCTDKEHADLPHGAWHCDGVQHRNHPIARGWSAHACQLSRRPVGAQGTVADRDRSLSHIRQLSSRRKGQLVTGSGQCQECRRRSQSLHSSLSSRCRKPRESAGAGLHRWSGDRNHQPQITPQSMLRESTWDIPESSLRSMVLLACDRSIPAILCMRLIPPGLVVVTQLAAYRRYLYACRRITFRKCCK